MKKRILIVEDDHLQQTVLAAALAADGHVVETCSDGLDAVWRIREGRFDIVLMDYLMPEIDGLATARLIHDLMGKTTRPRLVAPPCRITKPPRQSAMCRTSDRLSDQEACRCNTHCSWQHDLAGCFHDLHPSKG